MGFYFEEGGKFCRGCGWHRDGEMHDLIGRLQHTDPCPKCGRTGGQGEWRYKTEPVEDVGPTTFVIKFGEDQHD